MNPIHTTEVCLAACRELARRLGGRSGALVGTLLVAVCVAAAPAARADSGTDLARDGGLGAGAALATLVYTPVKLVYAAGGLVVGGLAWAFSGGDSQVAKVVFTPSVRGDYVITTEHLKGDQRLEFFGRDDTVGIQETHQVASAPPEEQTGGTADDWSSGW